MDEAAPRAETRRARPRGRRLAWALPLLLLGLGAARAWLRRDHAAPGPAAAEPEGEADVREDENAGRERPEPLLSYVVAWAVLMLLLGLSVLSAYLDIGIFHPIVNFGIAATQAAIVFIVFMRLRGRPQLKWIFAGAGFFWLLFLFGLGTIDYVTRSGWPTLS
jgi:caa(3)-type oxidase subunit IV